jgi:hypothetical protein
MIDKIIRLIKVERVDDIPVLLAQLQKMQVPALLDQFFSTHGHWKGELSFGEVVAVWLTFVASQGDHCLSHVQPWVEEHLDTLAVSLGKGMRPLDSAMIGWRLCLIRSLRQRPEATLKLHSMRVYCASTSWRAIGCGSIAPRLRPTPG